MRWRYLILGLFLAAPTAAAIHVWPQSPVYYLPGEDRYLIGDDVARGELLFFNCPVDITKTPCIERYNAATGKLKSSLILDCSSLGNWPRQGFWIRISDDGALVTWLVCDFLPWNATNYASDSQSIDVCLLATFDAATGRNLGHISERSSARHVNVSPNGKFCAAIVSDRSGHVEKRNELARLSVRDTISGNSLFIFSFAGGWDETFASCFSTDSRYFLSQRVTSKDSGRQLHLLNIESGNIERSFQLPAGRIIDEWKHNELRTRESLPPNGKRIGRFRHDFDGRTLGDGVADPLLEIPHPISMSPNGHCDHGRWVGQFEYQDLETPSWMKYVSRFEAMTGLNLSARPRSTPLCGLARIVDRSTNAICFEKHVPNLNGCRFILDGSLLVSGGKDPWSVLLTPGAATPTPPFEIYRTDPWPRWIWTALGTGILFAAFALLARWRHVVIRRRRLGEPGA
jgi:hypothetical protein